MILIPVGFKSSTSFYTTITLHCFNTRSEMSYKLIYVESPYERGDLESSCPYIEKLVLRSVNASMFCRLSISLLVT